MRLKKGTLELVGLVGLSLALGSSGGCTDDIGPSEPADGGTAEATGESTGDGDGDMSATGDGDGDGTTTGDGDGDMTTTGDGDGDETTTGDGDGDMTTTGDGDMTTTGDGDGDMTTSGDGDGEPIDPVCGNGIVEPGEACDDGNLLRYDGCEDDCELTLELTKIAAGRDYTCVLFSSGAVKCWGENMFNQLGVPTNGDIGDNELPDTLDDIELGGAAVDIAAGELHVCALMEDDSLRCWGSTAALGQGAVVTIGDDETPAEVPPIEVGAEIATIHAAGRSTCVVTDEQEVRCWGENFDGQLGLGHTDIIGDDELPSTTEPIDLGGPVAQLAMGDVHRCALLVSGEVRCWGDNTHGNLGLGHTDSIGDDELPLSVEPVPLGDTPVVQVSAAVSHSCVRYEDQTIRCWGLNHRGQLGYGHLDKIGDDELPAAMPVVDVGAPVDEVYTGRRGTCIRNGDAVKCWGTGGQGFPGQGITENIGDDELPSAFDMINVGMPVDELAVGSGHACARNGAMVRCWGINLSGQLGYGNKLPVGDDEVPADMTPVLYN